MGMEKIRIIRSKADARETVRYIGPMNEDTGVVLASLLKDAEASVTFNFREVNYVNSNGIRNWIIFLRDFARCGAPRCILRRQQHLRSDA